MCNYLNEILYLVPFILVGLGIVYYYLTKNKHN